MSQKYRHHGYQDSEHEQQRDRPKAPPSQNLTPEERIQRRSLRRATTREANEVVRCHNCGKNVQSIGAILADSTCPHCNIPLHCCRTCTHFDTAARWQCRAEINEQVQAKSAKNQCAQYQPRLVLDSTGRRSNTPQGQDPRAQFESLFKR